MSRRSRRLRAWSNRLASSWLVWTGLLGLMAIEGLLLLRPAPVPDAQVQPLVGATAGGLTWVDAFGASHGLDASTVARTKGVYVAYMRDIYTARQSGLESLIDADTQTTQERAARLYLELALSQILSKDLVDIACSIAVDQMPASGPSERSP